MAEFQVSTSRLNTDAEAVGRSVAQMSAKWSELKENLEKLDSMWDGATSETFKKTFREDIQALESVIKNLQKISGFEKMAEGKYEKCERIVSDIVAGIY